MNALRQPHVAGGLHITGRRGGSGYGGGGGVGGDDAGIAGVEMERAEQVGEDGGLATFSEAGRADRPRRTAIRPPQSAGRTGFLVTISSSSSFDGNEPGTGFGTSG
jgi:hypothetical protein